MINNFMDVIKTRRSYYAIGNEKIVPEATIEEAVKESLLYTPSAFNSQGSKAVLLFGKEHEALWEITRETLRKIVPEGAFASTDKKITSFKAGYGTVLFFEDYGTVELLQKQFALYKDNFPVWAEQSNGMLQFVMWTSLEALGLGASLQHYNPLIDDEVKAKYNIPASWRLTGQMPFGSRLSEPNEKTYVPMEERLKIFR